MPSRTAAVLGSGPPLLPFSFYPLPSRVLIRYMAKPLLESPTWCRIGECDCPEYEAEEDASPLTPCELCDHPAAHHSPPVKLTLQQATEIKARGDKALEYCKAKKEGLPCGCPCFIPDTLQATEAATEGRSTQGVCALCQCRQGWHNFNPKLVAAEEPPFGVGR